MAKDKKKTITRVGKIAVNVFTVFILLFVLFIVVNWFASRDKNYTSYFGTVFLPVKTDSMDGDKSDSFKKGSVIRIKVLNESEKKKLRVGDIITFWENVNAEEQLNTHRIVSIGIFSQGSMTLIRSYDEVGQQAVINAGERVQFQTKGDNPQAGVDITARTLEKIVGVYKAKASGIGSAILWLQTPKGFMYCAIVPSAAIFVYCMVMVILNAKNYSSIKTVATKEDVKQQLLEELRKQGIILPAETIAQANSTAANPANTTNPAKPTDQSDSGGTKKE